MFILALLAAAHAYDLSLDAPVGFPAAASPMVVTGATPGATVHVWGSRWAEGRECPIELGVCLSLPAGAVRVGTAVADLTGRAVVAVTLPADAIPGRAYAVQAGSGATLSRPSKVKVVAPSPDLDGDGLSPGLELVAGCDPEVFDTDGDGLDDGTEVLVVGTDPGDADTDNDLLPDGDEVDRGTLPRVSDTDRDGLPDGVEVRWLGTDPLRADTDGDGVSPASARPACRRADAARRAHAAPHARRPEALHTPATRGVDGPDAPTSGLILLVLRQHGHELSGLPSRQVISATA